MKSYTDLEQSKKLAEILPIESADMHYSKDFDSNWSVGLVKYISIKIPKYVVNIEEHLLPCWSLVALLDVLPEGTRLLKSTTNDTYHCDCPKENIDKWFDNPVDVCYEMIIKLHEQNIL